MLNESERIKLLGVRIDNLSRAEINDWIKDTLDNPPRQKFVATLNPEIALKAHYDKGYREILNGSSLNICDGFGIKLVSFLKGKKIKARYTGAELVEYLFGKCKEEKLKALAIVAQNSLSSPKEIKDGVKKKFDINISAKFFINQKFFEDKNVQDSEVAFINFGAPEQEKFIFENRKKLPKAKILVGVGGAFDFLTGKMKRAPKIFQKTGMEWLWRLFLEPKRIKRIWNAIFVFPYLAITKPD